jgi:hypothetical protein
MKISKVDLSPGAMELRAVIKDRAILGLKTSEIDMVRETKYKVGTVSEYRRKLARAGLIKRGPNILLKGKSERTWVTVEGIRDIIPSLPSNKQMTAKLEVLGLDDIVKIIKTIEASVDNLIAILKK